MDITHFKEAVSKSLSSLDESCEIVRIYISSERNDILYCVEVKSSGDGYLPVPNIDSDRQDLFKLKVLIKLHKIESYKFFSCSHIIDFQDNIQYFWLIRYVAL